MAKRKKHARLPNGFGSVRYLGKGRRNAYAVHPPVTEFRLDGSPVMTKPLCYTDSWLKGVQILTAWHAGTYVPGMEIDDIEADGEKAVEKMLANFNRLAGKKAVNSGPTFKDVYKGFYEERYEKDKSRTYSSSARHATSQAFNLCSELQDKPFTELRHKDLQGLIDGLQVSWATVGPVITLLHQIYRYAVAYEIVDRDYSATIKNTHKADQVHGCPFTNDDLKVLWKNADDDTVKMILIMCYSGFRISEFQTLEVNFSDVYFKGGIKTKAGKGRIVPIHSAIVPLVKERLKTDPNLISKTESFRKPFTRTLEKYGINRHTPHDCRHTFSALCERYHVAENDRKRMMGHSFGNDITNSVYGHRTVEDLRTEIEKIKIPL